MLNQVQHDKMVKNRYKLKSALSVSSASKELENSKFKVQSSIFACMICLHDSLDADDADDADSSFMLAYF